MQIRGCHSLLPSLKWLPIQIKIASEFLTMANKGLRYLALPASSIALPGNSYHLLSHTHQAGFASEHLHLLFPLPNTQVLGSSQN